MRIFNKDNKSYADSCQPTGRLRRVNWLGEKPTSQLEPEPNSGSI